MARIAAMLSLLLGASATKSSMLVDYKADGADMQGYITYDKALCTSSSKCPAVIIMPDWNGMNDYEKERACMLADSGIVAFAADIYGVDTPKTTMQHWIFASSAHRNNATMFMNKMHGAISQVMTYNFVDTSKMAAIGYCFGGTGVINIAMAGYAGVPGVTFPSGLLGVVSFHGGLSGGYVAPVVGNRPKLLVHSGAKDDSNANIEKLTDDLENVSAIYEINRYGSNVVHSFTEWNANSPPMSMFSPSADKRSWEATTQFFRELFSSGVSPVGGPSVHPVAPGYVHSNVSYTADGEEMLGWMIYKSSCTSSSKCPLVVVIHDWNGMNEYEQQRAYLLAGMGYVAFAADIYGVNTPKAGFSDWMAASSAHRNNATKYMNKIHGAIAQGMTYGFVDSNNMAAIGYCFGGTGLINIAMAGYDGFPGVVFPAGLKGVVSFHGGLSSGYEAPRGTSRPKVLIHSGAKDDSNADISKLTDDLENVSASYEITRYGPNVLHSFTEWSANTPGMAKYDNRADFRSWHDTQTFLKEIFVDGVGAKGSHPGTLTCDEAGNPTTTSGVVLSWASSPFAAIMCLLSMMTV